MADKTTTGLTAGTTPLAGSELVYGVQGGNSRKFTASDVAQSPHTQTWGTITSTPTTLAGYGITDAQPLDSDLTAIAALTTTGYGRAFLALADEAAFKAYVNLEIGTDVQAFGATLTSLEGLSLVSGDILYATGADTLARLPKGTDGQILNLAAGLPAWSSVAGTGDMVAATYDPQNIAADAFDRANHTGAQAISTVTGLQTALDDKLDDSQADTAGLAILGFADPDDVRDYLDVPVYVADRTALKAIDTTKDTVAILKEAGRQGSFIWRTGDFSAQITADTAEGIYVKATAIASSAGAWVRQAGWAVGGADALWFGVVADGVTNCAAAINSALAIADTVLLPPGSIAVGSVITMPRDNTLLKGAGMFSTTLLSNTTNAEIIAIPAGSTNRRVSDLTGSKDGVTPVAGGWGLRTVGTSANCEFSGVQMRDCYQGFRLSACDVGSVRNCLAQENVQDGFFVTNESGYGPCQWGMSDILVQANGRDGIRVESVAGPAGLILGTWSDIRSFANSGFGMSFLGAACAIFDIRADNIFLGADNLGCIYLDTYGGHHRINGFIEYAGESVNGPGLTNPAGHNAPGVSITANNIDVTFYGTTIDHNAIYGIYHLGGTLILSGCVIDTNGVANVASTQYGVYTGGGRLITNGCRIGNFSGTTQKYGIVGTHNNVVITGNDLSGNATAATFGMGGGVIANNI